MFRTILWRIIGLITMLVILTSVGINLSIPYILRPYQQVYPNFDLTSMQWDILKITTLITVIAIAIGIFLTIRSTRPIRDLTDHIETLTRRIDIDVPAVPSSDEINHSQRRLSLIAEHMDTLNRELSKERAILSVIMEEITDGVVMIAANGNITIANQAALNIFSTKLEKVIGRSLAEGFRQHQLVDLWRRAIETNLPQVSLLEVTPHRVYLQCIATPLEQPLAGNTLLFLQNLTQQRYLETMRRDFISNISHELRTPLASLKALVETLQDGALDDAVAARRFLQLMQAEVDALSQMVSELLELSRLESGRMPLKMQPVDPQEILSKAMERLRLQAERAGLNIQLDVSHNLPMIVADPQRLEQVIVNLLHNAIKFTPGGGRITLGAYETELSKLNIQINQTSLNTSETGILFFVRDTGQGIAADELKRIFERFYKIDRARASSGTGLGLAIARHTVEAHGGKIWAESTEGAGSTFYFFIPSAV